MRFEFFFSSDTAVVPIYIDPTSGDEATLGAYKLQACIPLAALVSPGGSPLGERMRVLGFGLGRLKNPTSAAMYVWRAFVSKPDPSGNPDASTAYELRSDMPLPAALTLSGKLDRTHHRVLLKGRLTTKVATVSKVPRERPRMARTTSFARSGRPPSIRSRSGQSEPARATRPRRTAA